MLTRHISRRLVAYLDGALPDHEARRAELHLRDCVRCRTECEQIRSAQDALAHLPLIEAPDSVWASIESGLRRPVPAPFSWRLPATAAALALVLAVYWFTLRPLGARWEVLRLAGAPVVGTTPIANSARIGAGQWIETDASSRATVVIGAIGSVTVAPNTRLRVVTAKPGEHRLALAHGRIQAKISAPPRLFFVDTAAGTAVDLGCEYTLDADEAGSGLLRVSKGWVSFQWKGFESLVPAGASCPTRPALGPGIPYFDDASAALRQALDRFGVEKSADDPLGIILSAARVRDTLTLWHLLSRVGPIDRARVYERIAALTPPPASVTREQVLRLDPDALRRWREDMAWKW
jgi:FecR-like protein/putative zinc finger protein